ncbi:MAG TPA: MBL fold metallo-hydrolase [Bryobacteraceae bacterium]|jgi:glyoxylase-like metal-dependent hydrolase (beta-lactamase superfamily II)|nr:MBL fold metallo-hydrolase [Bryobacteraceae bacterium]
MKISAAIPTLAALAVLGGRVLAQAPVDYNKVQITSVKLAPNFYVLNGQGGAIGVLTGPDGVLMVDSQFAPLTEKIVAEIKKVSNNAPIKFLINTHVHPDHTGGNENLGKMGVTIFAREELRNRLAHPNPGANGQPGTPAPAAALPVITYESPLTFHIDGEDARAIPIPKAHTDGDTLVFFPNANVIMIGDYFRSLGYPNIDRANGGSLNGMLAGIDTAIKLCNATTKVVPGHGEIVDRNGLAAHRDMIIAIRDKIAPMVSQGKTLEEVMAAKPTAAYDAKVPDAQTTIARFVGQVYAELKAGK